MTFKKLPYLFLCFTIIILTTFCSSKPEQITKQKYKGIDKTLHLLNSSSEAQPNKVEILFYGQSIIGGMKTNILVDSLKKRFPHAQISFKHKPIGGFTIPDLTKTISHDVYQENPDLIVFHAYGGVHDGLYEALIKNIRKRIPSDILLLDHHYVWDKPDSKLESVNKSHEASSKIIKQIADQYDCGFVNVRAQWKAHLDENNIAPNELMGNTIDPNVHPNDRGNELLRQIILSKFPKTNTSEGFNIKSDSLREVMPLGNSKQTFTVEFTGTVVELVSKEKTNTDRANIEVLIDGKKPSTYKNAYHIDRPSQGFQSWMPGISQISFGSEFPREEDWTIKIYDIDRIEKKFKFSLKGSLTGFDGEGNNDEAFISNSNRITIAPEDFNIFRTERILKNETPDGFEIKFKVNQIVRDTIRVTPGNQKYLLYKSESTSNKPIELKLNVIEGELESYRVVISKPYISGTNE